jgi:transposase
MTNSSDDRGLLLISLLGREIVKLGHDIKRIPAQHVTPFVRGNNNNHNDAFAITEVSQRPHIRFVPIITEHQQDVNYLHRMRERLIKSKSALGNQSRGLLSEFGVESRSTLKWHDPVTGQARIIIRVDIF